MTTGLTFDLLLATALLWSAWRTLVTPDIFRAVILFIVFGLLMTLAWAQLAAPDIALAEAAIGAGLTGALLLDAIGVLRGREQDDQSSAPLSGEGGSTGSQTVSAPRRWLRHLGATLRGRS